MLPPTGPMDGDLPHAPIVAVGTVPDQTSPTDHTEETNHQTARDLSPTEGVLITAVATTDVPVKVLEV